MALSTPVTMPQRPGSPVMPSSIKSDWTSCNTAPNATDNSAATIVNPGLVTRAAVVPLNVPIGTTIQVRMRYNVATPPTTSPVIQVFGYDANNRPQRLKNAGGTHELTLTVDGTNDVRETAADTTVWAYTEPGEVDAQACQKILVLVKTAVSGGTASTATLEARVK